MFLGIKLIKFLLFVFNFIFAIFGIAILALGVVYKLQIETIVEYLGKDFSIAPDIFIAIGTVAFVISFFGCIGASRENRPMLITFVVFLVLLLIAELAVVIIAFIGINNDSVYDHIEKTIRKENGTGAISTIEKKLECCGISGASSYTVVPPSCFRDGVQRYEYLYESGCLQKIKDTFHDVGSQLGALAIAVAIIQILGGSFAITLLGAIKKQSL